MPFKPLPNMGSRHTVDQRSYEAAVAAKQRQQWQAIEARKQQEAERAEQAEQKRREEGQAELEEYKEGMLGNWLLAGGTKARFRACLARAA
jgi:hypothetical protein